LLRVAERLLDRHGHDVGRLEGNHVAPLAILHRLHRRPAEAGREQAVVTGWHATPLEVPQNKGAAFLAGALLDLAREPFSHATHALRLAGHRFSQNRLCTALWIRPFGDDHYIEEAPTPLARHDRVANNGEIERNFGNENRVRGTGDS